MERRSTTGLCCKILVGIAVVGFQLSDAPSAWAQAKPAAPLSKAELAAAKKDYAEGDKKFKAGDYAGAEAAFKGANDIKAAPQTERFIGLCEDKLGHPQVAVEWFDRFLAHPPEKMAEQADEIRKREGEIKATPGKVRIESTPSGASVVVDDRPQAARTPTEIELAPGQHVVKLSAAGSLPTQKTVEVAFASSQTVSATLDAEPPPVAPPPPVAVEAPPPPAAPPPPPVEPRSQVPAYVTGGLAIVAAGVGTAFGIVALNDKSQFNNNPTTQTADNGDTHALISDMAFGVALTFGVTSAVLFLTRDEPPATPASAGSGHTKTARSDAKANRITLTPTPIVSPHSGGAGFTLRF